MKVKKGDFIEIDYTGKIKITNKIFDLTDEALAKKEGIFNDKHRYGPMIICIGEGHVLAGLDEFLEDKEVKKEYDLDILPQNAFGPRVAKLIKLTTLAKFKAQKVTPFPGMQFAIDGVPCVVRSVSGGRVILDFNHPLAGKELHYWIRINKKITDTEEKLKALSTMLIGYEPNIKIDKNKNVKIKLKSKLPKPILEKFKADIKRLITELKKIDVT